VLSPRLSPLLFLTVAACAATPPPEPEPPPPPALRAPDFAAEAPPPPKEVHVLELTLSPVQNAAKEIDRLDVRYRLSEPPGEFGDPRPLALWLASSENGEGGWAEALEELYARDGEGALALKQVASEGRVEWRADRRAVGSVRVGYRVRVARSEAGKVHGTRAIAGGFVGTGSTFLALPESADAYEVRLAWDLANAGEGASALSSFGAGAAETNAPFGKLREAVYMAGAIGRMTFESTGTRAIAGWVGRAALDPLEAVPWMLRAHAAERALFKDGDRGAFAVFVRAVPGLGTGLAATARAGGLSVLAGEEATLSRSARFAVAEGMARRWIDGESGARLEGTEGATRWYHEGFAAYFAREALLAAGLCTPEEALAEVNERLAKERLGDADRGMLLAAELDTAMRARSGDKRALADLVLATAAKARAAAKPGESAVIAVRALREEIAAEIGAEGAAKLDAVAVRGETIAPASDAFGPCFKRDAKKGGRKGEALAWARDPKVPASACARRQR
jgi:hypothetical protein